jgi:hypothetical protein
MLARIRVGDKRFSAAASGPHETRGPAAQVRLTPCATWTWSPPTESKLPACIRTARTPIIRRRAIARSRPGDTRPATGQWGRGSCPAFVQISI